MIQRVHLVFSIAEENDLWLIIDLIDEFNDMKKNTLSKSFFDLNVFHEEK